MCESKLWEWSPKFSPCDVTTTDEIVRNLDFLSYREKAIAESDLGIMPTNDGTLIRINIPALTEERRKEMMKQCKKLGEDGKVALRNIRRDAVDGLKKMEKNSDISEDESKSTQDDVQKMTDAKVKEIDTIVSKKEAEVMKV